jgi:hypothetical protein
MILGFGNNVVSSLASDITASQTSFSVLPGDGPLFAALLTSDFSNKSTTLKNYAKITLTDSGETAFEVCHLTAVNGDTLTVIRGQEGTAAKGWSLKDVVANFATRGSENAFPQIAHIQSGFYTSGTAGGTANALTLELPTTFFLNGSADWVLKTPIVVYPSQNNTGAATLQLTMGGRVLGTFPLYKGNKAALVANDILKDVALLCLMDNTKSFFNVANPGAIYAGLGTAAFRDAQTSKDDITDGRVLVNGSAVAVRSVKALAGATGNNVADANNLPTNSVSFVYSTAGNSPGITGSLMDFCGLNGSYNVQIAAAYNGAGNNIKFRTFNGDAEKKWNPWYTIYHSGNKPTAVDVGALPITGGTLKGALAVVQNGPGVALQSSTSGQGVYLIGKDYNGTNTWYAGRGGSSFNISLYNYKGANGINLNEDGSIALNLANGKTFTVNGQVVPSTYANFDARYQPKGNYTPAGQAYTKAESDARYQTKGNYISAMRLGSQAGANNNNSGWAMAPGGAVLTGSYQDANYTAIYYRYPQYQLNGSATWYNTGAA